MSTLSVADYTAKLFSNAVALCEKYPDAIYNVDKPGLNDYDIGFVECGPPEQGCLFGQANRMMKEWEQITLTEGYSVATCIRQAFAGMCFAHEAIQQCNMMDMMQDYQDKRIPWGTCLMMVR